MDHIYAATNSIWCMLLYYTFAYFIIIIILCVGFFSNILCVGWETRPAHYMHAAIGSS
jgi:hypothetical protein